MDQCGDVGARCSSSAAEPRGQWPDNGAQRLTVLVRSGAHAVVDRLRLRRQLARRGGFARARVGSIARLGLRRGQLQARRATASAASATARVRVPAAHAPGLLRQVRATEGHASRWPAVRRASSASGAASTLRLTTRSARARARVRRVPARRALRAAAAAVAGPETRCRAAAPPRWRRDSAAAIRRAGRRAARSRPGCVRIRARPDRACCRRRASATARARRRRAQRPGHRPPTAAVRGGSTRSPCSSEAAAAARTQAGSGPTALRRGEVAFSDQAAGKHLSR